jgi:PiT family inorganic phosphate transporter
MVAAPIASRAIRPRQGLILAAIGSFIGPFLFGIAVATTIGTGITDPSNITLPVVVAATLSAVLWALFTWWRGIPSSSSHALIGGLVGAIIVSVGIEAINIAGLFRIGFALLVSPIAGLLAGFLLMRLTIFLVQGASPRINKSFKRGQLLSSFGLALSQGTNDAQKVMGIIAMGLVAEGLLPGFVVPIWVTLFSAIAVALGTALGGWRLIATLGYRIYKVRPVHGLVSQVSAASVILAASLSGGPISTTQVVSSSLMGAGSAERVSMVRWKVGYQMMAAWVITLPISCVLAAVFYYPMVWLASM